MSEKFNQYTMYSYMANLSPQTEAQDNRILVDIKQLEEIDMFDEISKRVNSLFGDFNEMKTFEYPEQELSTTVYKKDKIIAISAKEKNNVLFTKAWQNASTPELPNVQDNLIKILQEITK